MYRARAQMWESLPTVIQEAIVDLIPPPNLEKTRVERNLAVLKSRDQWVVVRNGLDPRLVNKMFAERLMYQVDLCQTKDANRFVRAALKENRLRLGPRGHTIDIFSTMYVGVYELCHKKIVEPDKVVYHALLEELPKELPLVPPQLRKGFLDMVRHVFTYLDRYCHTRYRLPDLKTSFRKIRRRLFADYRRLLRRISLVLLTNLAEVRAAAAP